MELIKSKGGRLLSLFLILSLGSFVNLLGMEKEKGNESGGSSSDEETTQAKWSEEQEDEAENFISLIVDSREKARASLEESPRLSNYLNYRSPDESREAAALALQHPRNVKFESDLDRDLSTPLLTAMGADEESLALMKELLDRGANIDLPGSAHHIPVFFEAIRYNLSDPERVIRFLANYDKEIVNRPAGRFRQTPLQFAVVHARNENIIPLLLSLGANINAKDKDGWTALHYAVYRGDSDAVRTLLAHGANPSIRANDGRTADMVAIDSPHYGASDAAALVAEAGINIVNRLTTSLPSISSFFWGS